MTCPTRCRCASVLAWHRVAACVHICLPSVPRGSCNIPAGWCNMAPPPVSHVPHTRHHHPASHHRGTCTESAAQAARARLAWHSLFSRPATAPSRSHSQKPWRRSRQQRQAPTAAPPPPALLSAAVLAAAATQRVRATPTPSVRLVMTWRLAASAAASSRGRRCVRPWLAHGPGGARQALCAVARVAMARGTLHVARCLCSHVSCVPQAPSSHAPLVHSRHCGRSRA
jgi:hypothetical protein